jgi:hypothetical protein
VSLATRIRENGGAVEYWIYPEITHTAIVIAFAPLFRRKASVLDDVIRFIQRQQPHATR